MSKSLLLDLQFSLIMIFILRIIFSPIEDWFFFNFLNIINIFLSSKSGITWNFQINPMIEGVLATLVTIICIDGASFFIHRLMHKVAWLKRIHAIHHSATELNFFTALRQHPLEPLILNSARSIASAIGLGVFHWFFSAKTPVYVIYELGAGFFIYMFTVNLHHSHVPVHYPKFLRYFLISPHVHHLHHSKNPVHFGKNYGVVFSFWDKLFGTYCEDKIEIGELRFGLVNSKELTTYWRSLKL
jgi:sterol desaturase/sphingolipid hydroxylase (fatty acid hydroxylase superfamily)